MKEEAFLIVKPEGLVCCPRTIEKYLNEARFEVVQRIEIEHWPEFAREIYTTSDKIKNMQLEAWLRTIALFFPENYQKALYLGVRGEGDILEQQKRLNQLKDKLRSDLEPSRTVSILYQGSEEPTKVYFTYVHVPDASDQVLKNERRMLERHLKND